MVVSLDDIGLPQQAHEQHGRENQVDQRIGDEHDAKEYHDESHHNERSVDAESTPDLFVTHTQQQRYENDSQQPGIFHQQIAGHDDKVLADHSMDHSQNNGKGHHRHGHDDAGALGHKGILHLGKLVAFHQSGGDDPDGDKVDDDR